MIKDDDDTNHEAHDDDADQNDVDVVADDDMDQNHDIDDDDDDNHEDNDAADDDNTHETNEYDVNAVDDVNEDDVDDNDEDDDDSHEANDDDVDDEQSVQNNEEAVKDQLNQFEQGFAEQKTLDDEVKDITDLSLEHLLSDISTEDLISTEEIKVFSSDILDVAMPKEDTKEQESRTYNPRKLLVSDIPADTTISEIAELFPKASQITPNLPPVNPDATKSYIQKKPAVEATKNAEQENMRQYKKRRKHACKYKLGDQMPIQPGLQLRLKLKLRPKFFGPYETTKVHPSDCYEARKIRRGGPILISTPKRGCLAGQDGRVVIRPLPTTPPDTQHLATSAGVRSFFKLREKIQRIPEDDVRMLRRNHR
ncbi:nucleolin-like [Stegodyphus dumicola]|uniref:nucleolin-like n=1 Tax=Stegodyphus dumicola TaxID=202533 RepID=UPI0015B017A1|nr:nucleolin-like [Stegodyphus dumicola]